MDTNTIIIGASAAGLSCAVCLQKSGIPFTLLEQSTSIGNEWKKRYQRLHLHTPKNHSHLPYLRMPERYMKYVSKHEFATYLEDYVKAFNIKPTFNQRVIKVEQGEQRWVVNTEAETYTCKNVIIATGYAERPVKPRWRGLENFRGNIIHSSEYTNGKPFKDKKVLVVGFGNSACEIALCLYEHQAKPALSVRSGVNILPREIAGISIVEIALLEKWLIKASPVLADWINKPVLELINGNINKYGLRKSVHGPITQMVREGKVPLLDIGTLALIKEGKISVFPDVAHITSDTLKFSDGREEPFEVIILATGFSPSFSEFLMNSDKVCDVHGIPHVSGQESKLRGLFFCGFHVSPTGMIREIGIEARRIAHLLRKKNHPG